MRRIALAALGLLAAGCASFEGARLYKSGTEAIEAGDPVRAVHDLERAAELVPQASEIQNHLGIAYLQAGRRDQARVAFDRALALDCNNSAAIANRALVDAPAP
jgi:Flp pilus assembly protein TadD